MKTLFTISRDKNGNKTCKIRPLTGRAFSIQTNGNLPETHRNGVSDATRGEVLEYVSKFGTKKQCELLSLSF
jgi:hypothetical protein